MAGEQCSAASLRIQAEVLMGRRKRGGVCVPNLGPRLGFAPWASR
jgi:hypothetical protein